MTLFLMFWIACLFVQKSASLTSEANVSIQTTEHTSPSPETTHNILNEEAIATTSANDIECSNTQGCVSPRNIPISSTIPPLVSYKVSWKPFTIWKATTEATQTNTDTIPFSRLQGNIATNRTEDTTTQRNDDGNELDSEVKAIKHIFIQSAPTEASIELMEPTNLPLSETNNLVSKNVDMLTISPISENSTEASEETSTTNIATENLTDITTESLLETSKIENLSTLIPILAYSDKKSTVVPIEDYSTISIPSESPSQTTSLPISSSEDKEQYGEILTMQNNLYKAQLNLSTATTEVPHVQTENLENTTNSYEETTSVSTDVITSTESGRPELNILHESTIADYLKEFGFSNTKTASNKSEFEISTLSYGNAEELMSTTKSQMGSETSSYMPINVSHKEILEGHGLGRNLPYFISSTELSDMGTETEVQTNGMTEEYSTKDIPPTMVAETTDTNIDETSSLATVLKIAATPDLSTNHPVSTFEPTRNHSNLSEERKFSTSVTKLEHSTHTTDIPTLAYTTSHAVNENDLEEKNLRTTDSLDPEGRLYEEDIIDMKTSSSETPVTENPSSVGTTLTPKAPYTEESSSTTIRQFQTLKSIEDTTLTPKAPYTEESFSTTMREFQTLKPIEDTTPIPTEVIIETENLSSSNISHSNTSSRLTTKESEKAHSTLDVDHSLILSTTESYITYKAAETTTAVNIDELTSIFTKSSISDLSSPLTTNLPSNVFTSSSEMPAIEETEPTRTVTDTSLASSLDTESTPILTNPVTIQSRMGRKDAESITTPSFEQTTFVPPSSTISSISTQVTGYSSETYPASSTASSVASTYSEDYSTTTILTDSAAKNDTLQIFSTTSSDTLNSSAPTTTFSIPTTTEESLTAKAVEKETTPSSNIPFYSTLFTTPPPKLFTQVETRREGKHIPFSTVETKRETVGWSENGVILVTSTEQPAENDTKVLYQKMQFDELTPSEKANVITSAIQFSSKYLNKTEVEAKMEKVHRWLLNVLMKEFQNWTKDPFQETEDQSDIAPFGNISIFYISPTPELNSSGITLTFIVYNVWKNETLQVDFVLGILNYYSKELKESVNASAAYFYHGYEGDEHYLMSAILERYGVVIITIGLAVVLILLLVCVVVFYRKKTRRSVHCLSNSKFKQSVQDSVGIDLNPAIVILQDEKGTKVGNGNKICDDEGWLAPINDVPQAEDTNVPFVQDTKL